MSETCFCHISETNTTRDLTVRTNTLLGLGKKISLVYTVYTLIVATSM